MDFPRGRIHDRELLSTLHLRWRECALCGSVGPLSLHHINRHPRDDVEGNLIMLCGDGVRGCHGRIEARDVFMRQELAFHIRDHRPDTMAYLDERFPREGASRWLRRVLGA